MCEFKIIKKNDGSQIMEDIVILSYTENNELVCRDVLGMGEVLESSLIVDVNTINQTCVVLDHPIVKDFLNLIQKLSEHTATPSQVENIQSKLEEIKKSL